MWRNVYTPSAIRCKGLSIDNLTIVSPKKLVLERRTDFFGETIWYFIRVLVDFVGVTGSKILREAARENFVIRSGLGRFPEDGMQRLRSG
jgi:hypothetical protein